MRTRLRLASLVLVLVAACTPRPGEEALQVAPASPSTEKVVIHVATNRRKAEVESPAEAASGFTATRAPGLSGARFDISIPPDHVTGEIRYPKSPPDPQTAMTVVAREDLPLPAMIEEVASGTGRHNVRIFVHGYNTNFQEALFRLAQITRDAGDPGAAILFSWPSRGTVTGYAADREAVSYSRDHLAGLLKAVARERRIGKITVLGHSMGGWLVMEALRQLRLSGDDATIARLEVILAAPDIDIDVFRTQLEVVGRLEPPLLVLVSTDDRALRVSRRLNASRARVGGLDINDPRIASAAAAANVALVDIGGIDAGNVNRHSRYAILGALYSGMGESDGQALADAGAFVLERAGAAVASPFVLFARGLAGN